MLYKNKFRIESTRLPGYDYSTDGWYFITINTKNHNHFFGEIENEQMVLNDIGRIVEGEWLNTAKMRDDIALDYFVIMPNHFHAILIIEGRKNIQNLSSIIKGFKASATSKIRMTGHLDFSWQTRFYDRIIRSEDELFEIRKYIEQNPLRWQLEKDVPENLFYD